MTVDTIVTQGALAQNCYIISAEDLCIIIDPGAEPLNITSRIAGKKVMAILLTHRHSDHIGALPFLQKETLAPVYEMSNLKEQNYSIGPFHFQVIFTKGHTEDSLTYYFEKEKMMFTGDFLFHGDVGRCDLEGGSWWKMQESIHKIKCYPDDIKVYPGHEEATTLGEEKKHNPYFKD